jgi:peptidoglycan lytic transglycosylase
VTIWITATVSLMLVISLGGIARAGEIEFFSGIASFYDDDYSGKTANGDQYDPNQFTAAHPTLPFGTLLRVSDACNDRAVVVVINDRGPFIRGRVLDLSMAAAKALGMVKRGTLRVVAEVEHVRAIHLRASKN